MLVVDFGQLQAAIDHMAAYGRDVGECLEDVDRAMAALRATWHGEGSDAQAQAQQQWEDGAEQMKKALSTLKEVVQTAQTNYKDAVEKNSGMWNR
ncbi:WXG100 family type VII secretion target [Mycolicibacterium houstonense]|uniref:WXG100 family type VII secretion target n=1 Tax=Mycolicibacterium houstonense TaxID=146021 RepID=UPI003F95F33F